MGTIKYSKIVTSNGELQFSKDTEVHEKEFDNMEYLKIYDVIGHFKVYINNSKDYVYLKTDSILELQDFQINSIKIEAVDLVGINSLQYYLCK
ncbi:hypothetical protein CLOACE_18790 [Clostridium acetireducens DSM 10703]|uniref:Uncharacterized protein n=1 Tax=Clostridium acetireducens DSM 10703 TaxID=1121290 RepID=A0A1E8EWW0_9CLOT|nr:hypothetical protein [Clostridium acetireducens]OFI05261.1 hypothetical protein CLOACE_18790 [Clostridium acetireducens DSM 10703]